MPGLIRGLSPHSARRVRRIEGIRIEERAHHSDHESRWGTGQRLREEKRLSAPRWRTSPSCTRPWCKLECSLLKLEDITLHNEAKSPVSTHDAQGHIALERAIDSITLGTRNRTELGDLQPLMGSIKHLGLLQPVTVTPDGLAICGRRRLEAVTRLGWRTVQVWVRVGISDELARLVAEQDENATHKPLSPIEAARLFREMRELMHEDARRQHATGSETPSSEHTGVDVGSYESPEPASRQARESRVQAARFVTQRDSQRQLERICEMERLAADRAPPAAVRQVTDDELVAIRNGGPVVQVGSASGPSWTSRASYRGQCPVVLERVALVEF